MMSSDRYNMENMKKALRNPSLIGKEIYRLSQRAHEKSSTAVKKANNIRFRMKYGDGEDFMQKDWDNLIILDALRYDYFEEQNHLDGNLSKIVSRGAHSWEFMEGNFVGKEFHDTVYVTANPHTPKLSDDVFYTIENLLDRWDSPGTVLPEEVVAGALEVHEKYPDKRLVIHFMQPHAPHLGPTAERYREECDVRGWNAGYFTDEVDVSEESGMEGMRWDNAAESGEISREQVRNAYSETLDIVLDYVEDLVEEIDGKSVITGDHGQMLGERLFPGTSPIYGHPHDIYTSELCVVPWFEMDAESRRDVRAEDPIGREEMEQDVVNERLQALGYAPE